jgi:hypothetical protein
MHSARLVVLGRCEQAPSHACVGHSPNVMGVTFTFNNTWLISIGGDDCAVFKWRVASQEDEVDTSKTIWCVVDDTSVLAKLS